MRCGGSQVEGSKRGKWEISVILSTIKINKMKDKDKCAKMSCYIQSMLRTSIFQHWETWRYTDFTNRQSFFPYSPTRNVQQIFKEPNAWFARGTHIFQSILTLAPLVYLQPQEHTSSLCMSFLPLEYLPYFFSQPPTIPAVLLDYFFFFSSVTSSLIFTSDK